jgi:PPK2 family polyphosphate:nucleotide phosphotransferase
MKIGYINLTTKIQLRTLCYNHFISLYQGSPRQYSLETVMLIHPLKPGSSIGIQTIDPNDTAAFHKGKEAAGQRLAELNNQLEILQEQLFAEHKHKVLVVLQGMDTSGKDGTIRAVFEGVNPQGVRVAAFKVPTPKELDHDYLWRVHKQVPGKGEIVIFNRSHYEDVLVVRVHNIVPEKVWRKRFDQINAFEHLLVDEGTIILKFFLHIDKTEQKDRLLERLAEKEKHWKFNPGDIKERSIWHDYMKAYEDVLYETCTDWAPWTVVPANKKWFRNLVIAEAMVEALEKLNIQLPPPIPPENVDAYRSELNLT